jgi:galactokinase
MHTQSSDDSDPYAADARALTEAQRVLSVARSTPQIPITSAEVAENQANALRAEISALKQSLAQERVHIDDLRAVADTAIKEMKSTLQKMQTLNEMHKREIMEKMNASQRSMAEEYELLMIKQQFLALEWDRGRLKAEKSVFEMERDRA